MCKQEPHDDKKLEIISSRSCSSSPSASFSPSMPKTYRKSKELQSSENGDSNFAATKSKKPPIPPDNIGGVQATNMRVLPAMATSFAGNMPNLQTDSSSKHSTPSGIDWKITMLDGTQTVELNVADEMGKQKKTHVCLFCGKIYNRKYGLKIHLRTHTGYKPLKCKVCSRPFSDPSNLNKHVRLHSQGDTPYRCPYCGKILVRKRDLDRHVISRHSGKDMCEDMSSSPQCSPRASINQNLVDTDDEESSNSLSEMDNSHEEEENSNDNSNFETTKNSSASNRDFMSPTSEITIQNIIDSK